MYIIYVFTVKNDLKSPSQLSNAMVWARRNADPIAITMKLDCFATYFIHRMYRIFWSSSSSADECRKKLEVVRRAHHTKSWTIRLVLDSSKCQNSSRVHIIDFGREVGPKLIISFGFCRKNAG